MSDDRVFFDTNVLVYANDLSEKDKRVVARKLLTESMTAGTASISTQVLAEFWVTVTRELPTPLSLDHAEKELTLLSTLNVIAVDLGLVLSTVKIQERYGISYWDAQILAAAKLAGCAMIYSEELQDCGEYEGIQVKNPFG
jgi:predicted nucleic acid-binding protein